MHVEARGSFPITEFVGFNPAFGVTVERGSTDPDRCRFPPCEGDRFGGGVTLAPGAVIALTAPEEWRPGPLADVHAGVLAQAVLESDWLAFRYGLEAGAAVGVAPKLALGLDVQATRTAQPTTDRTGFIVARRSAAVLARLRYTP